MAQGLQKKLTVAVSSKRRREWKQEISGEMMGKAMAEYWNLQESSKERDLRRTCRDEAPSFRRETSGEIFYFLAKGQSGGRYGRVEEFVWKGRGEEMELCFG